MSAAAPGSAPRPAVADPAPVFSAAANTVMLVLGALALVLFAAATAPTRILRAVSGGLVWRRLDLAFAAIVLLGVGLLAALVAAV